MCTYNGLKKNSYANPLSRIPFPHLSLIKEADLNIPSKFPSYNYLNITVDVFLITSKSSSGITRMALPIKCPAQFFLFVMNFSSGMSGLNSTGFLKMSMGLSLIRSGNVSPLSVRYCVVNPFDAHQRSLPYLAIITADHVTTLRCENRRIRKNLFLIKKYLTSSPHSFLPSITAMKR